MPMEAIPMIGRHGLALSLQLLIPSRFVVQVVFPLFVKLAVRAKSVPKYLTTALIQPTTQPVSKAGMLIWPDVWEQDCHEWSLLAKRILPTYIVPTTSIM